ncbi:GlcG/HbpS family heme-binding protein [Marinivivus vitaminiproducens]|uniref:GlcG/HbpS family heme-binding protein n=1 Tax=Marinivivus vitaminiproducens TaxID=3035935 RepID=UPI002799761F|nr:heme-binding protein [Geminicoccaceae bacterium SCSIO 64248]
MTTRPALKLTHQGALKALSACVAKAEEMGVGQNVTIVDEMGVLLAFARMDGAKTLSIKTSRAKALTAASHRVPTGKIDAGPDMKFAVATEGEMINLPGGLPIVIDEQVVGAIGVGSGTGAQDVEVARAGLAALGAKDFD